jgi:hypothetical protein
MVAPPGANRFALRGAAAPPPAMAHVVESWFMPLPSFRRFRL